MDLKKVFARHYQKWVRFNLPSAIAIAIWLCIAERPEVMKNYFGFVGISMFSSCATDKQEIRWRAGGGGLEKMGRVRRHADHFLSG
jgi:hypothetical protein